LLRRFLVDARVLNPVLSQMVKTGCALGAGRPRRAGQLLVHLFGDRDWGTDSGDELLALLIPAQTAKEAGRALWERIAEPILAEPSTHLRWTDLGQPAIQLSWSMALARSLAQGLVDPKLIVSELEAEAERTRQFLPAMVRAGLELPPSWTPPSHEWEIMQADQIVMAFEVEAGPLAPLPVSLENSKRIGHRLVGGGDTSPNPAFSYLRDREGIDTSAHERVAWILMASASRLADEFATEWSIESKPEVVHCFYDLLLVLSADPIQHACTEGRSDPKGMVFSACMDGIHFVHFGDPSHRDLSTILELLAEKESCYMVSLMRASSDEFLSRAAMFVSFSMGIRDGIEGLRIQERLLRVLELAKDGLRPLIAGQLRTA
jgi:hypothetical protein